jgi:methionyl-tRNA formyltransferase
VKDLQAVGRLVPTLLLRREGSPEMRLIAESVQVMDEQRARSIDSSGHTSGEIISTQGGTLIVRCGQGALRILALQTSGKRRQPIAEFLRGQPLQSGQRLMPINGSRRAR